HPGMRDAHGGEQHGDAEHDHADHQPAQDRAGHVAAEDDPGRHRADQQLLDVAPELGAEEARRDVAVAVLDHAHHDQAGDDEVHVADAVHGPDAAADQAAEDQEVQRHGDRRRHQGLAPDAQDAHHLAPGDGAQGDQVGPQHGHVPAVGVGGGVGHAAAPVPAVPAAPAVAVAAPAPSPV